MKFTIKAGELNKALRPLKGVLNAKSLIPIRDEEFLLEAIRDEVIITASNETFAVAANVKADVEDSGTICVNAKRLTSLISTIKDADVTFTLQENKLLTIQLGGDSRGEYSLPTSDVANYPLTKSMNPPSNASVLFDEQLLSGLTHTAWAVGTDTLRPQLMGVNISLSKDTDEVVFSASDTRKAARYVTPHKCLADNIAVTLPTKVCNTLRDLFSGCPCVKMHYDPTNLEMVTFSSSDAELTTKVVRGVFPQISRVIPQYVEGSATINRKELIQAIKRISMSGDSKSSTLRISIATDSLALDAKDVDDNIFAKEMVAAEIEKMSRDFVIGFNSVQLTEVLNSLSAPKAILQMTDASRPMLVREKNEDGTYEVILMPVRVS